MALKLDGIRALERGRCATAGSLLLGWSTYCIEEHDDLVASQHNQVFVLLRY